MKKKVEMVMLEFLYATVSQDVEVIEVGDWALTNGGIRFVTKLNKDNTFTDDGEISRLPPSPCCHIKNYRKVIATNDPELTSFACNQDYGICAEECQGTCNSIKRLSLSSIKEYVSNPDGEFEVEYEVEEYTSGGHQYTKTPTLKINQDNEVGITSVEKKMYSEEEVESILYQYAEDEHGWFSSKSEIESFNNWIEENL